MTTTTGTETWVNGLCSHHNHKGEVFTVSCLEKERFSQALVYALELHWDQYRKGTATPYFSHLMAVSSLVMEHGGNEDEVIAALLHDAAEDRGGERTLGEIREKFGPNVAELVRYCSDSVVDTGQEEKPSWEERKKAYLAHIKDKPAGAILISMADKLHNSRAILLDYRNLGDDIWKRFNPDKNQIVWYYRSLVKAFQDTGPSPLLGELQRVVTELEEMTGVTEYR